MPKRHNYEERLKYMKMLEKGHSIIKLYGINSFVHVVGTVQSGTEALVKKKNCRLSVEEKMSVIAELKEKRASLRGVMSVLDSRIDCGAVDSTRVYICGISMGGFGTWDALQRWPEKFAAAIPICGGGDPAYADRMKNIPIYIFHGLQDGIVMPSRSIQMYDALREVGNNEAVLVTYPELGHGCWDEAFSTMGLFEWMFGKKKLSLPDLQY